MMTELLGILLTTFLIISPDMTLSQQIIKMLSSSLSGGGAPCDITVANARTYSQHAPGLIFKREAVKPFIDFLFQRINTNCFFTRTYPQVAILWSLLLNGGHASHLSISIAQEAFSTASQLLCNGHAYGHPVSRLSQKLDAIAFLYAFKEAFMCDPMAFHLLVQLERKSVGWVLFDSLKKYDKDLAHKIAVSFFKEIIREILFK